MRAIFVSHFVPSPVGNGGNHRAYQIQHDLAQMVGEENGAGAGQVGRQAVRTLILSSVVRNSPGPGGQARESCVATIARLAVLILIVLTSTHPARGQGPAWSPSQTLFQTEGWTFHAASVVDANGRLVAIWQYNPYKKLGADLQLSDNDNDSLFVSRLDNIGWSSPKEVVLGRIASERLAVAVTADGLLHIFSQSSCLWYSRVPLEEVERPQSWSSPACLADVANTWPATTVSTDGRINLLYSTEDATALYLISSDDSGTTWSWPRPVIQSASGDRGFAAPAMAEDPDGTLHVVLAEVPLPQGYPPVALSYVRSTDRGITWSTPQQLAGPHQSQPTVVADSQGRIHIAWNGDAGDHGRYYVSSDDRGLTWNAVEVVMRGTGGLQMPPSLAIDDTHAVHGLFTDGLRLVYARRTSSGWSSLQELIGPATVRDAAELGEIDSVSLNIVNGDRLHAMYTRFNFGEVLHQVRETDAPRKTPDTPSLTVLPTTQSISQTTPLPAGSLTPAPTPTRYVTGFDSRDGLPQPGNPTQPLLISTAVVALLIGAVFAVRIASRR